MTAYTPMRSLGFILSLLLHASVVFLGLTWTGMFQPVVSLNVPVYNVDLVTLAPPAPAPAPPAPAPPKPEPVPAKPEPKPALPVPKPAPKPKDISPKKTKAAPAKKKKIVKKKPEPTPEQIMAKALRQAQSKAKDREKRERRELDKQIAALRKEAAASAAVSGAGNATGAGAPGLVQVYAGIVEQAIKKNWRYPIMGHERNIRATLEIDVAPDGSITDARLMASSGRPEFDASAMRAVAETKALPPPPQGMVDKVSITFNLQELNQ